MIDPTERLLKSLFYFNVSGGVSELFVVGRIDHWTIFYMAEALTAEMLGWGV